MLISIEDTKYENQCLVTFKCRKPNFAGVVAINSTVRGPALGGCRLYSNIDFKDAVCDAINLAKAMTYKNAITNLPYGGGKTVLIKYESDLKEILPCFAKVMNMLNGHYFVTEDVGTNSDDMDYLRKYTKYVIGEPVVEFIPSAAYSVYQSIIAVVHLLEKERSIKGLKIAVQGLGKVGMNLCQFLYHEGCTLYVNDIDHNLVNFACQKFAAKKFNMEDLKIMNLDVFSPCALGGVITEESAVLIGTKYIVPGANNPLCSDKIADILYERGIVYIPDFLSNAGGVIEVDCENKCFEYTKDNVFAAIKGIIYNSTIALLKESQMLGISPLRVAYHWVNQLLQVPKK